MLKLILALLEELTGLQKSNGLILEKLEAIQKKTREIEERENELMANQAATQAAVDALTTRLNAVADEQTNKVLPGIQILVSEATPINIDGLTTATTAVEAASLASDTAANPVPPTPPTV